MQPTDPGMMALASSVIEQCPENQTLPIVDASAPAPRFLALPSVVSVNNPRAFKHIQLEDHPRKRQCTWVEVPVRASDADQLLNNPPKPTDEHIPGQLPNEILKNWGITCSVVPEDLTDDTLAIEPSAVVHHDNTTI